MTRKLVNPDALHPAPGFSQLRRRAAAVSVHIAGQVALDAQFGVVGADLHAQTVAAMKNVKTAMDAVGVGVGRHRPSHDLHAASDRVRDDHPRDRGGDRRGRQPTADDRRCHGTGRARSSDRDRVHGCRGLRPDGCGLFACTSMAARRCCAWRRSQSRSREPTISSCACVRRRSTTVMCWIRKGHPHPAYHVELPAILGIDICGEIVETGDAVEGFTVGDRVTANPYIPCRRCRYCTRGRAQYCSRFSVFNGAYAELVVIPGGAGRQACAAGLGRRCRVLPEHLHHELADVDRQGAA